MKNLNSILQVATIVRDYLKENKMPKSFDKEDVLEKQQRIAKQIEKVMEVK